MIKLRLQNKRRTARGQLEEVEGPWTEADLMALRKDVMNDNDDYIGDETCVAAERENRRFPFSLPSLW